MKARSTLSALQSAALESALLAIKCAARFTESIETQLARGEDRLTAENLTRLAELSEHRLLEAFPELQEVLRDWEFPGGRIIQ